MPKEMMIIAGEASGDIQGAALVHEIHRLNPNIVFWGIGGDEMKKAGVELFYHVNDLGVTGFTEVIGRLPLIYKALHWAQEQCERRKPLAVILIDYPDFNLRLAKRIGRKHKVIYFISPQLWAWRSGRVKIVREFISDMLVLFPFEKQWYEERGVSVTFVGNPLVNRIAKFQDRIACRKMLKIPQNKRLIALIPGSRQNEVRRILPIFIQAAHYMKKNHPDIQFALPIAKTVNAEFIKKLLLPHKDIIESFEIEAPVIMRASDFAWVTSGTATLETALCGTPMIVVYKTSLLSYLIARLLVKIPFIGMVNLVAGKEVAPELIQHRVTPKNIYTKTLQILDNPQLLSQKKNELAAIQDKLGTGNAAGIAAETILTSCHLLAP